MFTEFLKRNRIVLTIFAVGFFLRLFYIGNVPGNGALFSDEAFSGYEAFAMLRSGHDSHGYVRPVYLLAWGSGQSAMQAYLIIPFMALFGVNSFSIRLPQALLGCLTLLSFYETTKRMRDEQFAMIATAVLAVMPWHVMQSRWALDCNMVVAFLSFATYFLLRAKENQKWLIAAFAAYGLSLYCYAAVWPVMPVVVIGSVAWMLYQRQIRFDRFLVAGAAVFAVLAVPLLLFLLVNYDVIPEIRSGLISVPRLSGFRSNELSGSAMGFLGRLYDAFLLFLRQDDGRISDTASIYGIYYKFSIGFILIGIAARVWAILFHEKEHPAEALIDIQLIAGVLLCGMIEVFFSRANLLHLPFTYLTALGVEEVLETTKRLSGGATDVIRRVACVIAVLYAIAACAFTVYYFTAHDAAVARAYGDGMEDTIRFAEEKRPQDGTIHVISGMSIPGTYLYSQVDPDVLLETRVWADRSLTGINLSPRSFWHYETTYEIPEAYTKGDIYICDHTDEDGIAFLREHGLREEYFVNFVVGY